MHIRRAQLPGPAYFHPYIYSPDLFQMQISNWSCGSGTDKYQWFIPHNNGGLGNQICRERGNDEGKCLGPWGRRQGELLRLEEKPPKPRLGWGSFLAQFGGKGE